MAKVKVLLLSVSIDMNPVVLPNAGVLAQVGVSVEAEKEITQITEMETPLIAAFRTTEGRVHDFNIPVRSASGLIPGKTYELEFTKVTENS